MGIPLRGELTSLITEHENILSSLDSVHGVMSHLLRLSINPPPIIAVTSPDTETSASVSPASHTLSQAVKDATASWSLTASDALSIDIAILPSVTHLAVAKDDVEGLRYCLDAGATISVEAERSSTSPKGVANVLDTSARTPLHTAALHGSLACTHVLLQSGGLVHTRDMLDHTPLYYVCCATLS